MKSHVKKMSVAMDAGARQTSVSVEPEFWDRLKAIAARRKLPLHKLIDDINSERKTTGIGNLSSHIRLFVLRHKGESD